MTRDLQGLRRAARRAAAVAGRQAAGFRGLGNAFERRRQELLEQYRCSACDGTGRELAFGPLLMGAYYRKCRGCEGRGWRVENEEGN